jgi:hypothetical protein
LVLEAKEIQLDTLRQVSHPHDGEPGTASRGYLRNYPSAFQSMQAADHFFVIHVTYFLDLVFQDFDNDLEITYFLDLVFQDFDNDLEINNSLSNDMHRTIAAAKGYLEREQTNLVNSILGQIKIKVAPPIQLPT